MAETRDTFADLVITFVADKEWLTATRARCTRPDGSLDGHGLDRHVQEYFRVRGASSREALIATALFGHGALYMTHLWHDALRRRDAALRGESDLDWITR